MQLRICFIKISVTSADFIIYYSLLIKMLQREKMGWVLQIRTQDLSLNVFLRSFFPFLISAFYHCGKNFNSGSEAQE